MQTVTNVLNLVKLALIPVLERATTIVDATAGNGHDTLFLAEHMNKNAHLYAFDVQAEAIAATKERTQAFASQISYCQQGHEHIANVVDGPIDVAMFNLGYLPGENHQVTTQHTTTKKAVDAVLNQLSVNGICVIVAYPGHPEGNVEAEMLETYFSTLPNKKFTVGRYRLVNHPATAPYAFLIEKTRA